MATICYHHLVACMHGTRVAGIADALMLAKAGINPAILASPHKRIDSNQVARLFKQVQLALDDEFMGFTAHPCRVGVFSLMTDAVNRSATLGEMLEKAVHFYNLITPALTIYLMQDKERVTLAFDVKNPEQDCNHFWREFWLVIWHRFPSWYIGEPITLLETHFSFAPPAHADELQIMFPAKLRFNCRQNRLVFHKKWLDKPLSRSQQELDIFLQNAPADFMTIPSLDNNLELQINRLIRRKSTDKLFLPSLEQMAELVKMNPQALHRRLRQSGTSYQKIKDNQRREYAIDLLLTQQLPVESIAERVGFSEPRSFTRAFKHWTGLSPRAFSKQERSQ